MSNKNKTKQFSNSNSIDELLDIVCDDNEYSIQLLGKNNKNIKSKENYISTQNLEIDYVLGTGGIPTSKLTIIHGKEASGKTTLALHLVAECQRQNGVVIYTDAEYKLNLKYAQKLGVDINRMLFIQPQYLEQAFKILQKIIDKAVAFRDKNKEKIPIMIVLDSMNALISRVEFEGDIEDSFYAPQARAYSRLLPKLIPIAHKNDVTLLFISQVREKVGVMYGAKTDICGGKAPKFYSSCIIEISSVKIIKDNNKNEITVLIRKNGSAPPYKVATVDIVYGEGIDSIKSLIKLCVLNNLIIKSGHWYSYDDKRIGQGINSVCEFLKKDVQLNKFLTKKIREIYGWKYDS